MPIRNFTIEYKIVIKADLCGKKKKKKKLICPASNCNQCIFPCTLLKSHSQSESASGTEPKATFEQSRWRDVCLLPEILPNHSKVAPKLTLSSLGMIPLSGETPPFKVLQPSEGIPSHCPPSPPNFKDNRGQVLSPSNFHNKGRRRAGFAWLKAAGC